ncbi:MAG: TrmH family RNA methyltransferase [Verrucomicrobiia bacterium]|jgi:tRNA G18 (ribose-2'-O)-methylase SpoU
MLHVHTIEDLSHPDLLPYLTIRQDAEQRKRGLFIAEGLKITERLLESEFTVASLMLPEERLAALRPLVDLRTEEIHAFVAPRLELEKLAGTTMYQGVNAVGKIPAPQSLDDILQNARLPRFLVAIDDLTGADNMGTVARNATAFGADALIVGDTCCSPWLRKAVRTSMGTIFKIPNTQPESLADALKQLRARGIRTIAAHAHTNRKTLSELDLRGDICIVLGSEGHGIREAVLAECDEHVIVPMANGVDSLNVGSAGSVFCYEVARQRQALPFT